MAFNINTLQLTDTTTLHLIDPTSGMPMWADKEETQAVEIVLYGRSSKQYRNLVAAAFRKQSASQKTKKLTFDEQSDEAADFLASVTKAMHNIEMDGVAVSTHDDFKTLYSNPALVWIVEQVNERLGDIEAFLQK